MRRLTNNEIRVDVPSPVGASPTGQRVLELWREALGVARDLVHDFSEGGRCPWVGESVGCRNGLEVSTGRVAVLGSAREKMASSVDDDEPVELLDAG
jgi:hypothetical protein